jgi:enamine deaminase RidA (YjgF/YER057c/UK114 family)
MNIERTERGPIMSRIVEYNGVVYLCGLTADNQDAAIKGQTQQILAKIDKLLAAAGTDKARMLTATVYLSDMSKKPEMNEVWQTWIDPANPPTRACVGTALGTPQTLIEIVVSAAKCEGVEMGTALSSLMR